jgi:CHAD domain-containing protein
MPRFNKSLTGVTADAPVDRVAHEALTVRLRAVQHFLGEAVGGEDEPEAVHQLRIWTRRTAAALRLFAEVIGRRRKWMKRTLRKLRRAAGEVRDCDVHRARLERGATAPTRAVQELKQRRRAARKEFKAIRSRLKTDDLLQSRSEQLLAGIQWQKRHSSSAAPPFADWYRRQIVPLGDRFLDLAGRDVTDDRQLHEMRIAGKRLRYALELAGPALPAGPLRQLYNALSALQDRLGEVCDHLAAVDRAGRWLAEADKQRQRRPLYKLLQQEEEQLQTTRLRFERWWTADRRDRLRQLWSAAVTLA